MRRRSAAWIALCLVAVAGGGFLYGFLASEHGFFPSSIVTRVENKLRDLRHVLRGRPQQTVLLPTTLIRLNVKSIHVPSRTEVRHGSLTAAGQGMLLMTGGGEVFYYALEAAAVTPSGILLPDNHVDELRAVTKTPKYADYVQDSFTVPRYLHLLHVVTDSGNLLFVSYTEWHADRECLTNTLARLDVSGQGPDASKWKADPQDWRVIFRTGPCLPMKTKSRAIEAHISGGRMVFDTTTQRLLLTEGDFHWDGVANDVILSQDDSTDYGKIISIGLNGESPEHVAKGLRNATGITIDDAGRVWVIENGPSGGDELNVVRQGDNFGWPLATLGKWYNGLPMKTARQYGRHDDFVAPVYSWLPSVGMSSIIQIHGFDPSWDGDLLIGSMNGHTLYRVRIVDGRALFSEAIGLGVRIRYILQLTADVIAVWTDASTLMLVTRAPDDETDAFIEHFIDSQPWSDGRRNAARAALAVCTQCHTYAPTPGSAAPSLVGVYNRPVAGADFPSYSAALHAVGGKWTEERLYEYLKDTQAVAPGSLMPDLGLSEQTAKDMVEILKSLDSAT